ncbi:MAG: 50S ribosomal protein L29 [Gammaproteobacteria bacterium]|nr:50S ribosomal protein L29 [Gammaproteobacteria bacterium]
MKANKIREMDATGMQKELTALYKEQFALRMQNSTGQLAQTSQLKRVRRDIARIRTVMNEKSKGESA